MFARNAIIVKFVPNDAIMRNNVLVRIYRFYLDGFRSMTLGRTLWVLILVKLFVMFVVLKLFFFPDFLGRAGDDAGKADYVANELVERME